jgi:hypothetical protein
LCGCNTKIIWHLKLTGKSARNLGIKADIAPLGTRFGTRFWGWNPSNAFGTLAPREAANGTLLGRKHRNGTVAQKGEVSRQTARELELGRPLRVLVRLSILVDPFLSMAEVAT